MKPSLPTTYEKNEKVNVIEYYNEGGVCIKRTANGIDLPPDTEPSVVFLMEDIKWVEEKTQMTKEEFKNRFPDLHRVLTG